MHVDSQRLQFIYILVSVCVYGCVRRRFQIVPRESIDYSKPCSVRFLLQKGRFLKRPRFPRYVSVETYSKTHDLPLKLPSKALRNAVCYRTVLELCLVHVTSVINA